MINKKRLFHTLTDLLKINSPSGQEKNVANYVFNKLKSLGVNTDIDQSEKITGANTGNIIARVPGIKNGSSLMFSAHLDTIGATTDLKIIEEEKTIKSDNRTILGADDKAGLALILEMVQTLNENDIKHLPLEIVFTVSEEIGLLGANALDFSKLKSKVAFCFDGGGKIERFIIGAPSQEVVEVCFKGKAVHAGIEPEKGINAIHAAAKALDVFPQGRIDDETTANIGLIKGGKATNIVADNVWFKAEVRSHNLKKLENAVNKIKDGIDAAASKTKTKATIKRKRSFEGFKLLEEEDVVKIANNAIVGMGFKPSFALSGGASDANVFNLKGIRTLTLSMGGKKAHANEEQVDKAELVKATELAVNIAKEAHKVLGREKHN